MTDIRESIKKKGLMQWEVALKAGITESTLIRWLRDNPVRKDHEQRIMEAIRILTAERKEK